MEKIPSFEELGLDEWLVNQCQAVGMSKPTEIQVNCIPAIMKGNQVISILVLNCFC